MPSQTEAGKAFEYAILSEANKLLSHQISIELQEDSSFKVAKNAFELFNHQAQQNYLKASAAAINHIIEIEPRILYTPSTDDTLKLKISADSEGIKGDVRDVLFVRELQDWMIGISAKNNHRAVKHSRLSDKIDFGKEWLQINCSDEYFHAIKPVFNELRQIKEQEEFWRNLKSKDQRFYIPILEAFKVELLRLDLEHPNVVPSALLKYLIGNKDFYKVIKRTRRTELFGFHLHGTLNNPSGTVKPKFKVNKLRLPTRIIEICFKTNSSNTLILTCDEGWQIAFRIHNASSKVEPSLKFDINLIGQPQGLYSHHLHW